MGIDVKVLMLLFVHVASSFAALSAMRAGIAASTLRVGIASCESRSAVRASLSSEMSSAWKALGYNIGSQLGELNVLDADEVDALLAGMRAQILGEEPSDPLAVYVPMASDMLQQKQAAAAEKASAAGVAALEAAAAEGGATRTDSGLVVQTQVEGSGDSP